VRTALPWLVAGAVVAVVVVYPLIAGLFTGLGFQGDRSRGLFYWYADALADPRVRLAIRNTLLVATGATFVASAIGVGLAWLLSRTDVPGRRQFEVVAMVPMVIMPFVGGIAWTLLAAPVSGLLNVWIRTVTGSDAASGPIDIYSIPGLVFVLGIFYAPYVFVFTSSSLQTVDPGYEEAARIAGAGPFRMVTRITLPVVAPAILASTLMAWVLAAGQFGIPAVIGTPAEHYVLPTFIYWELNTFPVNFERINALGTILLALSLGGLFLYRKALSAGEYVTVTGKGQRFVVLPLGRWRWVAALFPSLYMLVVAVLPVFAIVYASFLPFSGAPLSKFGLKNYVTLLADYPETGRSIVNSVVLSAGAATLIVGFSLFASYLVVRFRGRAGAVLDYFTMLSLGVPAVVLSLGILAVWMRPPVVLYGTIWIMLIAYVALFIPFGIRILNPAIRQISVDLEEGARVAGATRWVEVRRILWPLVQPAVVAAWLMLFVICMRELAGSIFLYSPGTEVVAVVIIRLWQTGSYGLMAAFAAFILVLSTAVIATIGAYRMAATGAVPR